MQFYGLDHCDAMRIGLFADGFTRVMDSGARLTAMGLTGALELEPSGAEQAEVIVLYSNSRELPEGEAVKRTSEATRQLEKRRLFKNIDSTLRGHNGVEAQAVLQFTSLEKALICPAAPSIGRMVYGGHLLVNGVRLDQTEFVHDPTLPVVTADVTQF
jgi:uncharacterized protein YgbK (DUF1537 family)